VNKPAIALLLVVSYSLSAAVRAESGEKCKETVRAFAERIKTENGVASMKSEMEAVVKAGRLDQVSAMYGRATKRFVALQTKSSEIDLELQSDSQLYVDSRWLREKRAKTFSDLRQVDSEVAEIRKLFRAAAKTAIKDNASAAEIREIPFETEIVLKKNIPNEKQLHYSKLEWNRYCQGTTAGKQITVSYGLRTRQYLVRIENNRGGCGYKVELGWFVSALPSECRLDDREFVESLSVLK
jgi:hypothetical protein